MTEPASIVAIITVTAITAIIGARGCAWRALRPTSWSRRARCLRH